MSMFARYQPAAFPSSEINHRNQSSPSAHPSRSVSTPAHHAVETSHTIRLLELFLIHIPAKAAGRGPKGYTIIPAVLEGLIGH